MRRTTTHYSREFREQAVVKALQRGNRTIAAVAAELNISIHTLKNWLKRPELTAPQGGAAAGGERRASDWTARERLQALMDTHAMADEELGAWCRERGLFAHQLRSWERGFASADTAGAERQQVRQLRQEMAELERQLTRKDKALAEAAALLVLQKKYQALWEGEAA